MDNLNATGCLPWSFTTRSAVVISEFPYWENFEKGEAEWHSYGQFSTWAFGTPRKGVIQGAASGSNAWVTGGLGIGTYASSKSWNGKIFFLIFFPSR